MRDLRCSLPTLRSSASAPVALNESLISDDDDSDDDDPDDVVMFHQRDLPNVSFPVIEEIRRMGKLCDVTIRVKMAY